jgi:hypothetical protein
VIYAYKNRGAWWQVVSVRETFLGQAVCAVEIKEEAIIARLEALNEESYYP